MPAACRWVRIAADADSETRRPSMNELKAVALEGLRGENLLYRDLSLTLRSGEVLYIEGPNGAGKTSLLRTLAGLTLAESGHVEWNGKPIQTQRERFHTDLTYIGHQPGIKAGLSVRENLAAWGEGDALEAAAARLGIAAKLDDPVQILSAGQRRRVALCRLVLAPAILWILDEPYTALDAAGIATIDALIHAHIRAGGLLVLTSHQPPRLELPVQRLVLGP